MLCIYFGNMPDAIYNTSVYFDNTYLDQWLKNELAVKIIKDVDKATLLSTKAVDSKALGVIPVAQLSGGTKTLLLLLNKPEMVYNISTCGNNCAKWILRIAKNTKKDLIVNLHHIMDFGNGNFEIRIMNNDVVVHNMMEMVVQAGKLLQEGQEG